MLVVSDCTGIPTPDGYRVFAHKPVLIISPNTVISESVENEMQRNQNKKGEVSNNSTMEIGTLNIFYIHCMKNFKKIIYVVWLFAFSPQNIYVHFLIFLYM
jgi:hypothetical protein